MASPINGGLGRDTVEASYRERRPPVNRARATPVAVETVADVTVPKGGPTRSSTTRCRRLQGIRCRPLASF